MPVVTFDGFFRRILKGDIPRVVYLFGSEDVLKEEAIEELLDRVVDRSLRDFNVDIRSAATLEPEQAETLCHTLPMMTDRRVVVLRDVESWSRRTRAKGTVLRYLEHPAPETVLVLVQGSAESAPDPELAARSTAVAVEPLPPERARRWLEREASRLGLQLDGEAADHLAQVAQGNLTVLKTELAKLGGLAGGDPLGLELVASLLGVRHGETPANWRDLVLAGETARAIAVLPHLLGQSGVTGVSLVMLLGTSLVGLGLARAHYDAGARGGSLFQAVKRSLFQARPPRLSYDAAATDWSRLAPAWPRGRIEAAIRAALRADLRLKSTSFSDDRAILTDLVLELGTAWQTAA
jgi:DNA polymerase-3 subunit delta